jgi:hypothetical protein
MPESQGAHQAVEISEIDKLHGALRREFIVAPGRITSHLEWFVEHISQQDFRRLGRRVRRLLLWRGSTTRRQFRLSTLKLSSSLSARFACHVVPPYI